MKIFPVEMFFFSPSAPRPPRRRSISHESVCLSRMERRLKAEPSHLNLFCMLSRAPPPPTPPAPSDCYKCCLWSCDDNCEGHDGGFIAGLSPQAMNRRDRVVNDPPGNKRRRCSAGTIRAGAAVIINNSQNNNNINTGDGETDHRSSEFRPKRKSWENNEILVVF